MFTKLKYVLEENICFCSINEENYKLYLKASVANIRKCF